MYVYTRRTHAHLCLNSDTYKSNASFSSFFIYEVERNSSTIKLNCVFVIQLKKFPGDCTWTIQQNSVYEHTNGCQPGEEQMKATSKKSGNGSPPQPELFEIFKGFVIQNSTCKQMRCSLNSLGLLLDMSAEHLLNMKYRTRHMLEVRILMYTPLMYLSHACYCLYILI